MPDLRRVTQAARKLVDAKEGLENAVREAKRDGASLREIAFAANMSHEQVRRLTS